MEEKTNHPESHENRVDPPSWDPDALLSGAMPAWRQLPPPRAEHDAEESTIVANGSGQGQQPADSNPYAISEGEPIAGGYHPFTGEESWRLGALEEAVREWEYAEREPPASTATSGTNWKAIVQEIAETVVLTLLIFVMMRALIQNYRIEGYSMEPNLQERQYLIVNKVAYYFDDPGRGDIIVFEFPNSPSNGPEKDYIKRIIGLPGDTVECRPNEILVNGEVIAEPYGPNPWNYTCPPTTLGPDEYFVLGDNRPRSSDSHSWGPLERKYIIGKAWLLYWPFEDMGWVPNYPIQAPEPESPIVQTP